MTSPNDYAPAFDGMPPAEDAPAPAAVSSLRDLAQEVTTERKLAGHLVRVMLEDGDSVLELEARVDNRDLVRWDKTAPRQKWTASTHAFLFQSFVGWSALSRRGLYAGNFDEFLDVALEVVDVKADEDARPTR